MVGGIKGSMTPFDNCCQINIHLSGSTRPEVSLRSTFKTLEQTLQGLDLVGPRVKPVGFRYLEASTGQVSYRGRGFAGCHALADIRHVTGHLALAISLPRW